MISFHLLVLRQKYKAEMAKIQKIQRHCIYKGIFWYKSALMDINTLYLSIIFYISCSIEVPIICILPNPSLVGI